MNYRDVAALAVIRAFHTEHGYMPTVRELGDILGHSSPSVTHAMLTRLVREGRLEKVPGSPRTIRILDANMKTEPETM